MKWLEKLLKNRNPRSLAKNLNAKFGHPAFASVYSRIERPLIIFATSAALTAVLCNLDFSLLEANLYDFRVASGITAKPDPSIVLVTLDQPTLQELDEFSPLSMDYHARFMEQMERQNPKAIGYLIDFNRVNQSDSGLSPKDTASWSTRFVDSAHRMEKNGTQVLLGTPFEVTGEIEPPYPLSTLPHAIAVIHKDGNVFSQDKVTRRALTYLDDRPTFHVQLANMLGLRPDGFEPRGSYAVPEIGGKYFYFRYHGDTVNRGDLPTLGGYKRVPFIDVLNGRLPEGLLKDKIVLVGTISKDDSSDFAFTPYSKTSFTNPKIALHADILDSVIHDGGLLRAPKWTKWAETFAVTTFVIWWVLNSTPLYGVFATFGLALTLLVIGQVIFQVKGIWLRESSTIIGLFVSYYLVVPYRLIREYQKRWDFQRKNEILTQVEQLKTNFMSLVTHDLKTPVARIQGLAEVLMRKSGDRLIDRDRETLHHIVDSTEELNRFISSILELSKIESSHLQLKLESKDVNQVLERLIEGFRAQSRSREVKIIAELEPLFPIRLDVGLMSKVFNNLIDNALKYTYAGSEIRVSSREVGSHVEIRISDRGIGMSPEEIQKLFTKFYRAKNDTTTKIAGTGLGLYLSKFFIEAHRGSVEVESAPGVGTTFKILLPIDLDERVGDDSPGLVSQLVKGEEDVQSASS